MAANGAIRLRLAGEAIAGLRLGDHGYADGGDHLASTTTLIRDEVRTVREWFLGVADSLDPHAPDIATPQPRPTVRVEDVLDVLRSDLIVNVAAGGDVEHAKSLLWTSLYLTDLRMLETRLMPHVAAIA
jgi:hypothetical protein